jgi:hypothetical protein
VAAAALALVDQMRLEILAVMAGRGQTLIPLGLPQQVRAIAAITLAAAAVQRKTLTLIMVMAAHVVVLEVEDKTTQLLRLLELLIPVAVAEEAEGLLPQVALE